jgi:hypothetical protein
MQRTIILALIATSAVFAQPESKNVVFANKAIALAGFGQVSDTPVQGAPYTATITNESVQTLADGNRIVQTSTGSIARDSLGRTRQDAPLPMIGNMAPANAPHIVFLRDPSAQASYILNLTDKTATKMPVMAPPPLAGMAAGPVTIRTRGVGVAGGAAFQTFSVRSDSAEKPQTEDLGSQTMEGVLVNGTRTTRTIPAGQIGNEQPISIVTEVWFSPDLKTIVYSKRSDPRIGDQTFKLTNIVRTEPDPALFAVPADFKVMDAPQPVLYKPNGGSGQ